MAYIGRDISSVSDRVVLDNITTSATATYNLLLNSVAFVPSSAESLTVSLNGVIQRPQSSYTVNNATIVFDSALTSSDVIDFIIAERAITLTTVGSGSVGTSQLADGNVTTAKITDANITTAKIADDAVTNAKVNDDLISGATELTSEPADTDEFLVSDAGTLKRIDYSLIKASGGGGAFESALLHVQDQKSAGTNGGTDVSGYQTRDLNTVVTNEISGSSLSSNQITLPSGTFYIQASAPAYASGNTRLRLRNVSDSSNAVIGLNGEVSGTIAVTPRYFVSGRFTISSSKAFTIEQYVGTSTHSSLGHDTGDGLTEIYTDVHIWKVA